MMSHVVLLGDSIFDNALYVPDEVPVDGQLRRLLPDTWQVSLLAVDGAVTDDVRGQLRRLPDDATHLVVSCGGNDALGHAPMLREEARSVGEVMRRFSEVRSTFARRYRGMLESVAATGRQAAVCTVYDCVPALDPMAHAALALFNEIILREAVAARVPVIDLRLVCTEISDYSELSAIEPSARGGEKITRVIRDLLLGADSSAGTVPLHV